MNKIYKDNSLSIGKTPLIRLNKIGNGYILAKIESRNPNFSVKCRIGANMIWNAEKKGLLNKNTIIVEATSGNTGISLASMAASRQYKIILVMPDTMSIERQKLIKAFGATIKLTDGSKGMKEAINVAKNISLQSPKKYIWLKQFENPDNPNIHEKTTGPEIWNDTKGEIEILVSGVGTGGTITGISKFIKQTKKKYTLISVAVEPKNSPVITQYFNNIELKPGFHKIQGIGAGFIPKNLNLSLIDRVITVSDQEAITTAQRLIKEEGISAGISSGAALFAALKLQQENIFKKKCIVVILPSSGERYLSTELF
ncbi:MAG: cysteine synthase A [Buchnera aphidicola (Schlechtendalia peitan)]